MDSATRSSCLWLILLLVCVFILGMVAGYMLHLVLR